MPKIFASRVLWGTLLILAGLAFLLENMGVFAIGGLFWALIMALGGVFFLTWYLTDRVNWWAIIPGFTLLSIALLIFLGAFLPRVADWIGGAIVLGGIGAAFLFVYLTNTAFWWALIPAGVMLSIAAMITLEPLLPGEASPGILFLGIGLTFALLTVIPTPQGRQKWAWIPAGILVLMGLLFMASAAKIAGYLWPAALILAGLFLVLRTRSPKEDPNVE